MPSIGGYEFITLSAAILSATSEAVDISRPGVDGQAYREDAYRSPVTIHESVADFTTMELAEADIAAYEEMQSTFQTVIDDWGATHANVWVRRVLIVQKKTAGLAVGGLSGGSFIVRARWELQKAVA
jgi:hypothetical protein